MAIVHIPDRVCPHCGGTRWSVEPKKTGSIRYRCPVLAQERRKRWKANNPERVLQHLKTNAEKRVAAGYFKKRRQLIKQQSIINQQLNSNNMTNPYFYSWKDIKEMKELIRTGEPLIRIARREYERFGASSASAFALKLYKLAKSTTKIRNWEGPKRTRSVKTPIVPTQDTGVMVPEGTTFEGTPKKVVIYKDHFRIYF